MNKKEFIVKTLKELKIPLVSATGKDIVLAIEIGYRNAGWSAGGFSKATKKYFPDKKPIQPIFTHLLLIKSKSYCTQCEQVLDLDSFSSNKSLATGKQHMCKTCTSLYRSVSVDTKYYNAKRRAEIQQAIPPWADLNKIKEIYNNCPVGHHVDHIYPLNGKNICGLHVENNLQYLSATENMQKGNRVPD